MKTTIMLFICIALLAIDIKAQPSPETVRATYNSFTSQGAQVAAETTAQMLGMSVSDVMSILQNTNTMGGNGGTQPQQASGNKIDPDALLNKLPPGQAGVGQAAQAWSFYNNNSP